MDVEFRSERLNDKSFALGIGTAHERVDEVLKSLDFRNLDDDPRFAGQLTTAEVSPVMSTKKWRGGLLRNSTVS